MDTRDSAGQPLKTGQKHRRRERQQGNNYKQEKLKCLAKGRRKRYNKETEADGCSACAFLSLFILAASRDRGGGAGRTGSRPVLQQRNTGRQDCISAQTSQNQAGEDDDGSQV